MQKFLADAGVASRRAAEQFILEGRVTVNGHVVRLLGTKVDPDHDKVVVDGKPVRAKNKIYLALNKPRAVSVPTRMNWTGRRFMICCRANGKWSIRGPAGFQQRRIDFFDE